MESIRQTFNASNAKFTANTSDSGQTVLTGYAIVWGATSDNRGTFYARFTREGLTLADPCLALYSHDSSEVMGTTANNTLVCTPDDYGLKVQITPPNTSYAKDVIELIKGGYVSGMSFGMFPNKYTDTQEDGKTIRTFSSYLVDETTITAAPAFQQSSIAIKLEKQRTPEIERAILQLQEYEFEILTID